MNSNQPDNDLMFQVSLLKAQQEAYLDGVAVVSPEGRILSFNSRLLELWKISSEILTEGSLETAINSIIEKVAEPTEFLKRIEYLNTHPEEKSFDEINLADRRIFERYSAPVIGDNQDILGRVWFFHDVTEQRAAQKKIIEQQIAITNASRMASLGEMAAGIAHEINNPLTIINALNDQLKAQAEEGQIEINGILKTTGKIEATVARITKIVKSLRVLARDSSRDEFEETTVKNIISNTLDFCQDKLKAKEIEVQISDYPNDLAISCQPIQISQVLLNLIINALHAIEALPQKWIKLNVTSDAEKIQIAVTDSGPGIPKEIQDKMFRSFFTTKALGVGTGLGLNISRTIVELHEGTLEINNKNQNTSFVISLPRKQAS